MTFSSAKGYLMKDELFFQERVVYVVQFSKMVLAYDDSDGSKKALQAAVDLQQQVPESKLFVAHVFAEKLRNEPMDSGEGSIEPTLVNSYTTDGLLVPPIADRKSVV